MSKVDELKNAIETLPEEEYIQFRKWFNWAKWDAQLEADSAAGKLDFLVKEALHQKNTHKLGSLSDLMILS